VPPICLSTHAYHTTVQPRELRADHCDGSDSKMKQHRQKCIIDIREGTITALLGREERSLGVLLLAQQGHQILRSHPLPPHALVQVPQLRLLPPRPRPLLLPSLRPQPPSLLLLQVMPAQNSSRSLPETRSKPTSAVTAPGVRVAPIVELFNRHQPEVSIAPA
jgi:hypothetical protein